MNTESTDFFGTTSSVSDIFKKLSDEDYTLFKSPPDPPSMPVKKRRVVRTEDHVQDTKEMVLKARLLQNEVERLIILIENQHLLPPKAYKHFNVLESTKLVGLEEQLVGYLCKPQTITSCLSMYIKTMNGYISKITSYRDAKITLTGNLKNYYIYPLEYMHLINNFLISKRAEIVLKENAFKEAASKRSSKRPASGAARG